MELGNPLFIWALLAIPVPIIIHLFFRRHKKKLKFSATQLFLPFEQTLAYRRNLREILLLLNRIAIIILLVLALARLVIRNFAYVGGGRADTVIILDDTMSMQQLLPSGKTAYSLACRKADDILSTLGKGDRAGLVYLSGRQGVPLTGNIQAVHQALNNNTVTGAAGSFTAALEKSSNYFFNALNPNREVYIISDFQKYQMPAEPYRDIARPDQRFTCCHFKAIEATLQSVL